MPISKSRQISKLIDLNGKLKGEFTDSDFVSVSGRLGIIAPSGMTVVSSADTLPVTATNGDQAFVTSTNRLYAYSSAGWYNIGLINTTPFWTTEPASTYDLSTSGVATVIEIFASDSDGTIPTFTATTDSNFDAIATVTKDSDSRFIIIPIDSDGGSQTAGSGTITFKASDGVNIATAVSTFSITFVTNWATASITDNTFYSYDPSSSGQSVGYYGYTLRITKDNERVFTTGPDGSAKGVFFIYKRNGATYSNEASFYPGFNNSGNLPSHNNNSGAMFSNSFDIDETGERAVCAWQGYHTGTYSTHGAFIVLKRTGTNWASESGWVTQNQGSNNSFWGANVAMDGSGTYVAAFHSPTGSVGTGYLYKRTGTTWSSVGSFVGSGAGSGERFGLGGARMDATGTRIAVISHSTTGKLWIMRRDTTNFSATELATSDLGTVNRCAINGDGSYVIVGNSVDKEVYVYNRSGTTWSLQATIGPITQTAGGTNVYKFGMACDINYDGDHIIVGNQESYPSTIWIYKRSGTSWSKVKEIDESAQDANDNVFSSFGNVAINGDTDTLLGSGWYVNVTGSGQAGRGIMKTYTT